MTTENTPQPYESFWKHLSKVAFRQDWANVNGVRTRYVQAGRADAPALVMLHGTAGSLEAFCANLGEHSKHFNCYAIDLIGTGLTDKPDEDYEINDYVEHVRGFMEVMGIQKASLIGISLGTWIAARFALTHPDMVDKLTLNAPFGFADDAEEMAGIRTRRGRAFDDPSWENVKTIFDNLIYLPAKRIPDLIGMRQAMYQEPGARAGADHILNLFKPESLSRNLIPAAEWQKIVAPTLIVLSLKDRPLFVNTARNLINLIPNAQLLEMDDVGHWPQFENSALFNDANIRFLRGQ